MGAATNDGLVRNPIQPVQVSRMEDLLRIPISASISSGLSSLGDDYQSEHKQQSSERLRPNVSSKKSVSPNSSHIAEHPQSKIDMSTHQQSIVSSSMPSEPSSIQQVSPMTNPPSSASILDSEHRIYNYLTDDVQDENSFTSLLSAVSRYDLNNTDSVLKSIFHTSGEPG